MVGCSVISVLMFVGSLFSWPYHVTTAEFVYIQLNENGSLADDTPVPECTTGSRINILSYKYYNRKCQTNCINLSSEDLSSEAEIKVHEACSFKEKCTNMTFPVADIKSQRFNTVHVNYQCEDLQEDFYDMCRNDESILKSRTNIIPNPTRQDLEQCICYISDGTFSISVSDVRLQSKSGHNCSTHKLMINTRVMSCNGQDGEKMFNRHIEESQYAMIALTGISVNSPQMVWLTLTPREGETTIINCGTRSKTSSTITTTSTTLQSASFTDGIRMPKHDAVHSSQEEDSQDPTGIIPAVVVSIAVLLFIGLLGLLVYYTRRRRRQRFDAVKSGEKVRERNPDSNHWLETAKDTNDDTEDRRVSNIYNCINDSFTIETADNVEEEEEEYDTSLKQTKVCRNLDYNHLSEVGKPNISNVLENLLRSQDKTVYSLAKSTEEK